MRCRVSGVNNGCRLTTSLRASSSDSATAQVCDSSYNPTLVNCAEHCQVEYGEGYYSIGCDVQDLANYCGCKSRS